MLTTTLSTIRPLDAQAQAAARAHQDQLTKPPGALGQLEQLAVQLAGITGTLTPALDQATIVVVAADHGVAEAGVSAYPAVVTGQMVANFLAGGAAVNVLARSAAATVMVVDAGMQTPLDPPHPQLRSLRLGPGTRNLALGPAMTSAAAAQSLEHGIALAAELADAGTQIIGLGEMGIANTTAAACITAFYTHAPVAAVTGRGTGIDDERLAHKIAIVEQAVTRLEPAAPPLSVLSAVGGFEIGVLAGLTLGAAARRLPIIIDGFITTAAVLLAHALCPTVRDYCIAAHCSAEPGHHSALQLLGLTPLLQLGLRLGEGSGAALALPLIRAAARIPAEMATFSSAGVSGSATSPRT